MILEEFLNKINFTGTDNMVVRSSYKYLLLFTYIKKNVVRLI